MKNSVSNRDHKSHHYFSWKCPGSVIVYTWLMLAFCISCGSLPRKTAVSTGVLNPPISWFEADTGHFLFNTSIDVMKNHFSGLTVIKPMDAGNYRVIMITETGLKILDMEFFPDTAPKVHYIMEQMDKKILVRLLQKDMSIILMNHVRNMLPVWYEDFVIDDSHAALYEVNGEKNFYILISGQVHPSLALIGKGRKFRVEVSFFGRQDSGIDSLNLSHNNLDLSIRLFRIHEMQ